MARKAHLIAVSRELHTALYALAANSNKTPLRILEMLMTAETTHEAAFMLSFVRAQYKQAKKENKEG